VLLEKPLPDPFGAIRDTPRNLRVEGTASQDMIDDGLAVNCHVWGY
jgi:hypothetical protein